MLWCFAYIYRNMLTDLCLYVILFIDIHGLQFYIFFKIKFYGAVSSSALGNSAFEYEKLCGIYFEFFIILQNQSIFTYFL